ncbi:MAG: hypothetical protein FGM24_00570 [Candidatus Kapabacteria bacterium]|nr:hypothetical protein [Candidatus Kapabacteria bacterium]
MKQNTSRFINAMLFGTTFIVAATIAMAQRTEFRLGAINKTPVGTNEAYMTFGADVAATIGLDTALGEREIPSIPLPGDIFYMWTVVKSNNDEVWFNPKDFRPLRNERYIDSIDLRVQWTGGSLQIVSPGMKPAYIDSAYVVDAVMDFPNNVFKYKLWSGTDGNTTNPAITKFRLLVWYNGTGVSVADDLPASVVLGPVPFTDMLRIQGHGAMQHLRLIDMHGREALSVPVNDGATAVATGHLAAGPYIVELTDAVGTRYRRMIVRQ